MNWIKDKKESCIHNNPHTLHNHDHHDHHDQALVPPTHPWPSWSSVEF